MHRYKCWNGAISTTAPTLKQATGTATRTMLQISTPSTRMVQLISWGYSLDAFPSSGVGRTELIQTDVGCSGLTAHLANGVQPLYPGLPASLMPLGSAATGYFASGNTLTEGATAATRLFDDQTVIPTAGGEQLDYSYQWMPDERPWVNVSAFLRVRATFGASVNMSAWICWDE